MTTRQTGGADKQAACTLDAPPSANAMPFVQSCFVPAEALMSQVVDPLELQAPAQMADDAPNTSLDPEQLSATSDHADDDDQQIRFAPWSDERRWLLQHLWHTVKSPSTRVRIKACGRNAWVEYSPSRHRVRVRSQTCGSRLCPACRAKRAHILAKRMQLLVGTADGYALKLVTLTLKHSKRPLVEQLKALREAFKKLRSTAIWRRSVATGVGIIEVTRSKETGDWHPHLHVIARCAFIPHAALKAAWWKVTKTSNIVDIRLIRGSPAVARYVTSYLCKRPDEAIMKSPELSDQWSEALQKQHWIIPFGRRGSLPSLPPDEGPNDWKQVGQLAQLAKRTTRVLDPDFAYSVLIDSLNSFVVAYLDPGEDDALSLDG